MTVIKTGESYTIGRYTCTRSRGGTFTPEQIAYAKEHGDYALAAKLRGFTPKQMDADLSPTTRRFRTFADNEGRRVMAANLRELSAETLARHAASGKLDFMACIGGWTVAYLLRLNTNEYRGNAGWQHQTASPGVTTPLAEDGYFREVGPRLNEIIRRHNTLSNRFAEWLRGQNYRDVVQEIGAVDVEFRIGRQLCRAELKVCYQVGITKAIREALGQLLEYNHFGRRQPADHWFIVLDEIPEQDDLEYLRTLRNRYGLPLSLGWHERDGFHIDRLDLA